MAPGYGRVSVRVSMCVGVCVCVWACICVCLSVGMCDLNSNFNIQRWSFELVMCIHVVSGFVSVSHLKRASSLNRETRGCFYPCVIFLNWHDFYFVLHMVWMNGNGEWEMVKWNEKLKMWTNKTYTSDSIRPMLLIPMPGLPVWFAN